MTDVAFYNELADLVEELLADFGHPAVLRKQGIPHSGEPYAPQEAMPSDWRVLILEDHKAMRDMLGGTVTSLHRTLYISTKGLPELPDGQYVAPASQDRILVPPGREGAATAEGAIFGKWHTIQEVRRVSPGGIPILFEADLVR